MKKIPFVANAPDDMHCVNAVFRMVHMYFFETDLSWEEIDKPTKTESNLATWTFIGEMEFAKKGLKVTNIEPLDYEQLYNQGVSYLNEILGKETAEYYLTKSNIASVLKFIPDYLKIVRHETRRVSLEEIKKLLDRKALIGAEINSRILNRRKGFSLHFVLIYDYDAEGYWIHDTGEPPVEARHVTFAEFNQAFNFPGANGGITIFEKNGSN